MGIGGVRMQDRFRFRAWDKEEKKMFYNAEMTYDYSLVADACEADSFGTVLEDGNMIVMQCTGLKDKNGKLIYEGDILDGTYENLYVHYCDNCKQFQLKAKDYGCMACEGDIYWDELVESEDENELEVIGNIYENPELL